MSFQTRACVTAICDDCGKAFMGYEDEYTVHFESEAEALKAVTNRDDYAEGAWLQVDDSLLCPECACGRDGHALVERVGDARYCKCGSKWDRATITGLNDERINGGKS